MKLTRPIVFFDLETTGVDVSTARIVEISAVCLFPNGSEEVYSTLVNPGMKIPAEASEVHGIKDSDVKDSPLFKDIARDIFKFFEGRDLAGFNIMRYDIPVLSRQLAGAGFRMDFDGVAIVDSMRIFHMREPRDLSAAVAFYTPKFHLGAHRAEADVRATIEVLLGQMEMYEDLPHDPAGLFQMFRNPDAIDFSEKLVWGEDGHAVLNFGKYKGTLLYQTPKHYVEWMIKNDIIGPEAEHFLTGMLRNRTPTRGD